MYEIAVYITADGRRPYEDWVDLQRDRRVVTAANRRLVRAGAGNFGDHRYCQAGVWELKINFGSGYRLYYAVSGAKLVLLLCAGDKATQSRDIDRAVNYWTSYNRGEGRHETLG